MAEQHPKSHKQNGALLTAQSVVCGVVLLIALILRLIGGAVYDQFRSVFQNALTDNGIADAVSVWLSSENTDA